MLHVIHHLLATGAIVHIHRVYVTAVDGEGWKTAFDAARHLGWTR